jgi:hypothetical protein
MLSKKKKLGIRTGDAVAEAVRFQRLHMRTMRYVSGSFWTPETSAPEASTLAHIEIAYGDTHARCRGIRQRSNRQTTSNQEENSIMSAEYKEDNSAMHFDYDEDQELRDREANTSGKVSIKGETSGRKEWHGACDGLFDFSTNGPQGGDAGYGGFLRVSFTNFASTCMEVAVNGANPQPVDSVSIAFRGDAELHAAADCFEFLAAKLKYIRKLRKLH